MLLRLIVVEPRENPTTLPAAHQPSTSDDLDQPTKDVDHRDAEPDVGVATNVTKETRQSELLTVFDVDDRFGGPLQLVDGIVSVVSAAIDECTDRVGLLVARRMAPFETLFAFASVVVVSLRGLVAEAHWLKVAVR